MFRPKEVREVGAYLSLLDGLRSFYARHEGDDSTAAFSAAVLLAAMMVLNLLNGLILFDVFSIGRLQAVSWLLDHKIVMLAGLAIVLLAHLALLEYSGISRRRGPPLLAEWRRVMAVYVALTIGLLIVAMCGALALRIT